jgi:hypothetical protein
MGISNVVVRYLDGRIVKGFTQNFSPDKDSFHLFANPSLSGSAKEVLMKELKALFFVREFAGDSKYEERKKYAPGENPSGRKVEVRFKDGEVMAGSSLAFDRRRKGFFLFPADPKGNNLKIFVVFATVETISKVNPP